MTLQIKKADSQRDFIGLLQLRTQVFVLEQQVDINIEQDKRDFDAIHYVAIKDNQIIGCLRILVESDHVKIGRVAVHKSARGHGIGKAMLCAIEEDPSVIEKGLIRIHSQYAAKDFYEKLGYVDNGQHDVEAGILHTMMEKKR